MGGSGMKRTFRKRDRRILDNRFKSMPPASAFAVPQTGWIRSIRESLGMSAADLGHRLGIAPQSVLTLESSEIESRARLDTLKKAAAAMDCTFVYAFLPETSLEEFVQRQIKNLVAEKMKKVSHSMKLEDQDAKLTESVYADSVKELEDSPQIWRNPPPKSAK